MQKKFIERIDWNDTLLTKNGKQAIEDTLVDYHDIFARHRMDFGMNPELKLKLTPKDDKAVNSHNLTMPIHLKQDPCCSKCTNMEVLQYCFFPNMKADICTEETQRQISSSCGSEEN